MPHSCMYGQHRENRDRLAGFLLNAADTKSSRRGRGSTPPSAPCGTERTGTP